MKEIPKHGEMRFRLNQQEKDQNNKNLYQLYQHNEHIKDKTKESIKKVVENLRTDSELLRLKIEIVESIADYIVGTSLHEKDIAHLLTLTRIANHAKDKFQLKKCFAKMENIKSDIEWKKSQGKYYA